MLNVVYNNLFSESIPEFKVSERNDFIVTFINNSRGLRSRF